MIWIITTYQDDVFITPEYEATENGLKIKRGYMGNLRERYNGRRIVEDVELDAKDLFYMTLCFSPEVTPPKRTIGNAGVYMRNPLVKRFVNHAKKMAAAYTMSLALEELGNPYTFRKIRKRISWINIFHHTTYQQAIDELGFLFGVEFDGKVYGRV